jgi:hypothetical protein
MKIGNFWVLLIVLHAWYLLEISACRIQRLSDYTVLIRDMIFISVSYAAGPCTVAVQIAISNDSDFCLCLKTLEPSIPASL